MGNDRRSFTRNSFSSQSFKNFNENIKNEVKTQAGHFQSFTERSFRDEIKATQEKQRAKYISQLVAYDNKKNNNNKKKNSSSDTSPSSVGSYGGGGGGGLLMNGNAEYGVESSQEPPPPNHSSGDFMSSSMAFTIASEYEEVQQYDISEKCFLRLRILCGEFVNHKFCKFTMIFLLLVNGILLGLSSMSPEMAADETLQFNVELMNTIFLLVYTFECILNILHLGCSYFTNGWFVYDLVIVVFSWVVDSSANASKILKSMQIVRMSLLFTRITILKDLITSIMKIREKILTIICFFMLVLYVFTVLFTEMLKEYSSEYLFFGTFFRSVFSCLELMSLEWSDIGRDVWNLINPETGKRSSAYLPVIFFVICAHYIFFNLIIAVLCDAVTTKGEIDGILESKGALRNKIYDLQKRSRLVEDKIKQILILKQKEEELLERIYGHVTLNVVTSKMEENNHNREQQQSQTLSAARKKALLQMAIGAMIPKKGVESNTMTLPEEEKEEEDGGADEDFPVGGVFNDGDENYGIRNDNINDPANTLDETFESARIGTYIMPIKKKTTTTIEEQQQQDHLREAEQDDDSSSWTSGASYFTPPLADNDEAWGYLDQDDQDISKDEAEYWRNKARLLTSDVDAHDDINMPTASEFESLMDDASEKDRFSDLDNSEPPASLSSSSGARGGSGGSGAGSKDIDNPNQHTDSDADGDDEPEKPIGRIRKVRNVIGAFVNNMYIQGFIAILLVLNAALLGLDTSEYITGQKNVEEMFDILDFCFLIIFSVEVVMQLIYHGRSFFNDSFLIFDFVVVGSSWLNQTFRVFRSISILRILRIVRLVRALRYLSYLKALNDIMLFISEVLPVICHLLYFLLFIFYVFSVLFTELFSDICLEYPYFSTVYDSLFTCMELMTLEWAHIARGVKRVKPWGVYPIIIFIIMSQYVLFNMLIALLTNAVSVVDQLYNGVEARFELQKTLYGLLFQVKEMSDEVGLLMQAEIKVQRLIDTKLVEELKNQGLINKDEINDEDEESDEDTSSNVDSFRKKANVIKMVSKFKNAFKKSKKK